jgi:hypothetical protein
MEHTDERKAETSRGIDVRRCLRMEIRLVDVRRAPPVEIAVGRVYASDKT